MIKSKSIKNFIVGTNMGLILGAAVFTGAKLIHSQTEEEKTDTFFNIAVEAIATASTLELAVGYLGIVEVTNATYMKYQKVKGTSEVR